MRKPRKKGEGHPENQSGGLIPAVLLGVGVALALFFLLALAVAGVVWSGALAQEKAGLALGICAGLAALFGGRAAIGKGSGSPLAAGVAVGGGLCLVLLLLCLLGGGSLVFTGHLLGALLLSLAGGGLAGLMGKSKKKKKRR